MTSKISPRNPDDEIRTLVGGFHLTAKGEKEIMGYTSFDEQVIDEKREKAAEQVAELFMTITDINGRLYNPGTQQRYTPEFREKVLKATRKLEKLRMLIMDIAR